MDIYDIAKKSGYSIATVSRVLNNSENVSEKARNIILEVIEESNYSPNRVARSLAKNETSLVGIMVPDIRKYFESQSAYELEKRLENKGYLALLCDTSDEIKQKRKYLSLLLENKVEAIIGVGSTYEEENFYEDLLKASKKIPIALLNVNPIKKSENIIYVYIDEINAMDQSLKNLKEKGYKYPLYVSLDTPFKTRSYITKKAGYIEALSKYYKNVEFREFKIKDLDKDIEKLFKYLKDNNMIDSIQFELDSIAIKAYKAIINHGIRVPEDIAIVGYDNVDATNYSSKKISSIDQMISLQADIATDNLVKLIRGEKIVNDNMINAKFVQKETT